MRTKKLILTFAAMVGIIMFCIIFGINTFVASAETAVLSLNEKRAVTINANEVKTFYFTPDSNQHYVVETFGDLDTKLRISNIPDGEIINDDYRGNRNASIWFKAERNREIKIEIKAYGKNYGSTTLQVRKQRFSMFAYVDVDGNSTKKDLNTPFDKFCNLYDAIKYEDVTAYYARENDERNLSRLNSEIVFFSGHGYKNDENNKGFGISLHSNGAKTGLNTSPPLNFDKTKVAMWSACYSANSTNSKNLSFAEYTVYCGARSAVGFLKSVTFSSARKFTNKFFTVLADGATVAEAASKGKGAIIWHRDNAKL